MATTWYILKLSNKHAISKIILAATCIGHITMDCELALFESWACTSSLAGLHTKSRDPPLQASQADETWSVTRRKIEENRMDVYTFSSGRFYENVLMYHSILPYDSLKTCRRKSSCARRNIISLCISHLHLFTLYQIIATLAISYWLRSFSAEDKTRWKS